MIKPMDSAQTEKEKDNDLWSNVAAIFGLMSDAEKDNEITEKNSEADDVDDDMNEKEEKTKCEKCEKSSDKENFELYCKNCNLKVCMHCQFDVADHKPLFLNKNRDSFFVVDTCFKCNKKTHIYGTRYSNLFVAQVLGERGNIHKDHYESGYYEPYENSTC